MGSPYRKWSVPMRSREVAAVTAIQRASSVTSAILADRTLSASSTVKVRWAWPQTRPGEAMRRREARSGAPAVGKENQERGMCTLR